LIGKFKRNQSNQNGFKNGVTFPKWSKMPLSREKRLYIPSLLWRKVKFKKKKISTFLICEKISKIFGLPKF